jgi:hypothetical protein
MIMLIIIIAESGGAAEKAAGKITVSKGPTGS